ncbi:MAG: flocculation-associated PEP-CTERM protein PepA [Rubrivivax sp.]
MKITRFLNRVATAVVVSLVSVSAGAALIVDNATLDLRGLDGLSATDSNYLIQGIDAFGFNDAPIHVIQSGLTPGSTFNVDGKGNVSSYVNDVTGTISAPLLNYDGSFLGLAGYELTFTFSVNGVNTGFDPLTGIVNFDHTGGMLSLYLDNLSNGGKATPGTGAGYNDGILLATFDVLLVGNDGGSFNTITLDGSDDITFVLTYNLGALQDSFGNALLPGYTLAFSDSNFDADSNNNGLLDETRGGFGCSSTNQTLLNFCAAEDGTVRLATQQIPEPGALSLAALGLLGVGAASRRRKQRQ